MDRVYAGHTPRSAHWLAALTLGPAGRFGRRFVRTLIAMWDEVNDSRKH